MIAALALATRALGPWSWPRFHHLAQCLIPLAACGVFLGLSALTLTMLRAEGLDPPFVPEARAALLAGCRAVVGRAGVADHRRPCRRARCALPRRLAATGAASVAIAIGLASWVTLFFAG